MLWTTSLYYGDLTVKADFTQNQQAGMRLIPIMDLQSECLLDEHPVSYLNRKTSRQAESILMDGRHII